MTSHSFRVTLPQFCFTEVGDENVAYEMREIILEGLDCTDPSKIDLTVELLEGGTSEEAVNHPDHYGGADNPYEVIKVLEAWLTPEEFRGALKFNIHKYLARAKKKGGSEDIAKAQWYLNYYADYERRQTEAARAQIGR